jgi:hypothetical protein
VVRQLIQAGAPLQLARARGYAEMVRMLERAAP